MPSDGARRAMHSMHPAGVPWNPVRCILSRKAVLAARGTGCSFRQRHFSDSALKAEDHPWFKQLPEAPETLLPEERVLTLLSGNIAAGHLADVAQDWRYLPSSWHEQGMEVVLQTHLFAGFARAINGLATVTAVGVHCETPSWGEEERDLESWKAAGEKSCEAIYGRVYPKLRDRMGTMHPLLDNMMVEHGYGRVLSRPNLSLRLRELAVIAVLAGLDCAPQLNSHLRGAVRVGASEAEVKAVLAQTRMVWGEEAQAQADATLETVIAARYGL